MKSIRLSLIVYFVLLVGGALGLVSAFVYKLTRDVLLSEETARREKLQLTYEDLNQREEEKLDQALAVQVRSLADRTLFRSQWTWGLYQGIAAFGAFGAAVAPHGHVGTHLWLGMVGVRDANRRSLYPSYLVQPNIQVPEEYLPLLPEGSTEYYQINTTWKWAFHSESLGGQAMPFDPARFEQVAVYAPTYDEFELEAGRRVRRVTLKTPLTRIAPPPPRWPSAPWPPGSRSSSEVARKGPGRDVGDPAKRENRGPGSAPSPSTNESRLIYFQYAADTTVRDQALADLHAKLDEELKQHHEDAAAQLASVRNRLIGVGLASFLLTVLGGLTLVRHGLSPLRRLSDAVSRVSEEDIRLRFDEKRLPQELQPIVERLQQTLGMLRDALGREKQAAADISHELRTPLAALLTTTEVALRKPRSSEEYREIIQDCRSSCQQMSRLVERLLALSRLDAGVDRMRTQEIDAADLVEQCAGMVRPLAEARGLSLLVHRNGPAPATLDADKLREILTNLLHNAIEYNRPSGRVEVAVEQENGHLNLEVRDTGVGIAPEAQKHIFERFFRADPAREAESMHAGLGLAIVKGYLDLMGGTISVLSAQGQGSTFRVQLPTRPHPAPGS